MTSIGRSLTVSLVLAFSAFSSITFVTAQPGPQRRDRKPKDTWDLYGEKITQQVPQFGGFWYENGRLVIGLTKLTPGAKANSKLIVLALLKRREAETGPILYRRVTNNFVTIHAARKKIRSLLREKIITFLDTDERANIVRVGVRTEADIQRVRAKITGMGIADALFRIEQADPIPDLAADLISDLRQRVRPLLGGLETIQDHGIYPLTGTRIWSICTLGVVGRLNGIRGFFTNSHCTRVTGQTDSTPFYQFHWTETNKTPDNPADRIGFETVDAPILSSFDTDECPDDTPCQYADAAFVRLDSNVMARRGYIMGVGGGSHPTEYEITDSVQVGVCGQKVIKVGRATGLSRGDVEDTCSDYLYTSGIYKLCQDKIDAPAGNGDSGSAALLEYVSPNSSRVRFYGLVNGGNSSYFIVSPYRLIVSQIGPIDVRPGNDPPRVRITTPQHGASFGMNPLSDNVRFEADIFDPEGKRCGLATSDCTVTWTSNKDGVIGTGRSADFLFRSQGLHTITATARDGSLTATDQIAINISSTPPNITVVHPTGTIYRGIPYILYARATDSDIALLQQLECNRFTWTSSNQADIGSGPRLPETFCEVIHTFNTLGARNLIVEARDAQGDRNTKNVPVNVVPVPATGPPIISLLITPRIIGSSPNAGYFLKAAIADPDRGERLTYKWKVKYGDTEKVIKSREAGGWVQVSDAWRPSDHVPNRCGGWNATVTLEATDDQGQTNSASIPIHIRYPLC